MTAWGVVIVAVLTVLTLVVIEGTARLAGHAYRRWLATHRPPNPPEPEEWT